MRFKRIRTLAMSMWSNYNEWKAHRTVYNDMMKLFVPLAAITVLVAGSAYAAQPTPTSPAPAGNTKPGASGDLFGTTIIAKGKGVEVTRGQLDEDVIRAKSQLSAAGRPVSPDQTTLMEQQILDQLINVQL